MIGLKKGCLDGSTLNCDRFGETGDSACLIAMASFCDFVYRLLNMTKYLNAVLLFYNKGKVVME